MPSATTIAPTQPTSLKTKGADVIVAFTYNRGRALILSQRKPLGIDLPYVGVSATVAPSTLSLVRGFEAAGATDIQIDEMRRACATIGRPMMASMANGGRSPINSVDELAARSYACPKYPAMTAGPAVRLALSRLKQTRSSASANVKLHDFQHFCRLIGFKDVWAFERKWNEVT